MREMLLGLSETLSKLVSSQYAIAKAAGSVVFAESERTIIKTGGGASVWHLTVEPKSKSQLLNYLSSFSSDIARRWQKSPQQKRM